MFLRDGVYDAKRHHFSHLAVGVPGDGGRLHLAWKEHGKLPWKRLVAPAIWLAQDGFVVTDQLSRSLKGVLPEMQLYPASVAQFSRRGVAYEMGRRSKQPELARRCSASLTRGPLASTRGETAELIEKRDEGERRPHHPRGPESVRAEETRRRCAAPTAGTT